MWLSRSPYSSILAKHIPRFDVVSSQAFESVLPEVFKRLLNTAFIPTGWRGSRTIQYCKPNESILFDFELLELAADICG